MIEVEGDVFTGEGKAAGFLNKKPYREFIEKKLGFKPFPGTLNLKVEKEKAEKIKEKARKYRMNGRKYNGEELGGFNLYKVEIRGEKAGIVEPDLTRYGKDTLEIVADSKLRKKYNLQDSDQIIVTVPKED